MARSSTGFWSPASFTRFGRLAAGSPAPSTTARLAAAAPEPTELAAAGAAAAAAAAAGCTAELLIDEAIET